MHIDDFIKRVAGEPARTVTHAVSQIPAEVLRKASNPGGLSITELLSAPGRQVAHRDFQYGHILGPGASREAIDAWEHRKPSFRLPQDLRALVTRVNGIHLWADLERGRSYTGIAPIEEWDLARVKMYRSTSPRGILDDRYIALSYHEDGAAYVVLDVESGEYFLMDVAGADTTCKVATNVQELLDWLWERRIEPKAARSSTCES